MLIILVKTMFQYKFGSEIEGNYTVWDCDVADQCDDACIVSAQIPRDLLSVQTTALNALLSPRRSDLIELQLINPVTDVFLEVVNLKTPVQLIAPIDGDVDSEEYSLEVWKRLVLGLDSIFLNNFHSLEVVDHVS